ncbi:hypothetical protein EAH77_15260 [Ewingella americana]|uniref:Uncharacterized protein n=2 Tax=Ewingella americana TaxID=41202 RepID=A0A502GGR9_9GAMM|nr:hypothetical protein EAH77_15260 [Ewingella americana]
MSELKWASDSILRSLGYIANVRNLKSLDDFKESDPNAVPAKEDIKFSWGRGDASAVIKHWKDLTNLKCVTESKAMSELRQLSDSSRAYHFKDTVEHLERNLRNVSGVMYWMPETDVSGHANLILNMIKDITPTGCLISDAKDVRFYINVENNFIVKFN